MSRCRGAQDRQLASHVLAVHRDGRAPRPEGLSDTLTPDQLRAYIAEAKQHQPFIPEDLTGEGLPWFRFRLPAPSRRLWCRATARTAGPLHYA